MAVMFHIMALDYDIVIYMYDGAVFSPETSLPT